MRQKIKFFSRKLESYFFLMNKSILDFLPRKIDYRGQIKKLARRLVEMLGDTNKLFIIKRFIFKKFTERGGVLSKHLQRPMVKWLMRKWGSYLTTKCCFQVTNSFSLLFIFNKLIQAVKGKKGRRYYNDRRPGKISKNILLKL